MHPPFRNRTEAGRVLGAAVRERYAGDDLLVLGLPRGGVPVAAGVATAVGAPLDVLVVRKLGTPGQPELALGAIASGGTRVLNAGLVRELGITAQAVERVAVAELRELRRREQRYRGDRPPVELTGRRVVLVDDGLATGASVRAAVEVVRSAGPAQVTVAVPVGAPDACRRVAEEADDLVCLHAPGAFGSVGAFYADFTQVEDAEVQRLLAW